MSRFVQAVQLVQPRFSPCLHRITITKTAAYKFCAGCAGKKPIPLRARARELFTHILTCAPTRNVHAHTAHPAQVLADHALAGARLPAHVQAMPAQGRMYARARKFMFFNVEKNKKWPA